VFAVAKVHTFYTSTKEKVIYFSIYAKKLSTGYRLLPVESVTDCHGFNIILERKSYDKQIIVMLKVVNCG